MRATVALTGPPFRCDGGERLLVFVLGELERADCVLLGRELLGLDLLLPRVGLHRLRVQFRDRVEMRLALGDRPGQRFLLGGPKSGELADDRDNVVEGWSKIQGGLRVLGASIKCPRKSWRRSKWRQSAPDGLPSNQAAFDEFAGAAE